MNEDFRRKERRRQARLERLGTNTPRCVICGEGDPACLELHHLEGRKFGDDEVILCRNCHRKERDLQSDHPEQMRDQATFEERLLHFLLGAADLLQLLVNKMREFARNLATKIQAATNEGGQQ